MCVESIIIDHFIYRNKGNEKRRSTPNESKEILKHKRNKTPMALNWQSLRSNRLCFFYISSLKINRINYLPMNSIQLPMPATDRSTTQAEELRQQRNEEVRQLIGSSVDKAKAIFAQNTAAGQLTSKTTKTAPVKPVRNSITRSVNNQPQQQQQQQSPPQQNSPEPEKPQQQQQQQQPIPQLDSHDDAQTTNNNETQETSAVDQTVHDLEDDDSDPFSTIKRSPYSKTSTNSQNEQSVNNKQIDNVQAESVEKSNGDKQPIAMIGKNATMISKYIS